MTVDDVEIIFIVASVIARVKITGVTDHQDRSRPLEFYFFRPPKSQRDLLLLQHSKYKTIVFVNEILIFYFFSVIVLIILH